MTGIRDLVNSGHTPRENTFGVCPEFKALIFEQLIALRAESVDSSEPQRYPAKALAKSSVGIGTPPYCTRHIVVNQSFGFPYVCLSAPVENGLVFV
ncbi:MAG: hypothetical protein HRU48_23020 [Vibrio sp.]|nr:hypothetical protein [Vibrio sp.]